MISIDQALDRLLHVRSYRRAFLEGRSDQLDLAPEDLVALATIDREQLERTAERIQSDLLGRKHRGSGGLIALFPRTIEAWRRLYPDDVDLATLVVVFMESEAFGSYRQVPWAGLGRSLEEAFFLFCEHAAIGAPDEDELLGALIKALAVSPTAAFSLPPSVHEVPGGFFAVTSRASPRLYAAVHGRLTTGAITPFLAELLLSPDTPAEVATRHRVADDVLRASLTRLAAMGLRTVVAQAS